MTNAPIFTERNVFHSAWRAAFEDYSPSTKSNISVAQCTRRRIGKAYLDMEAMTDLSNFFAGAAIPAGDPYKILKADLMRSERKCFCAYHDGLHMQMASHKDQAPGESKTGDTFANLEGDSHLWSPLSLPSSVECPELLGWPAIFCQSASAELLGMMARNAAPLAFESLPARELHQSDLLCLSNLKAGKQSQCWDCIQREGSCC